MIMDEKLKIFLKYPNAEIVLYDLEIFFFEHIVSAIAFEITDFSDCKIRLKSLEDMTNEDNIKLNTVYDTAWKVLKLETTKYFHAGIPIIDWLRENNYDIDGLIGKGWAERITE